MKKTQQYLIIELILHALDEGIKDKSEIYAKVLKDVSPMGIKRPVIRRCAQVLRRDLHQEIGFSVGKKKKKIENQLSVLDTRGSGKKWLKQQD